MSFPTLNVRLTQAPSRGCLVGLAASAWALGVHAAVVHPSTDLLRPGGDAPGPAATTLERALTVDTNTSQRNLDLLLDARRAGQADVGPALRNGPVPDQRRALPTPEPRSGLVPLGLQGQDSVVAPGATERREWQMTTPTGRYGGSAGATGSGSGGRGDPDTAWPSDRRPGGGAPTELSEQVKEAMELLREHRFALLGGAALLAVAVAALQAYFQRR